MTNHRSLQLEFINGAIQIWKRNFLNFRKTWLINLFWIVIEPLFYLVALGYGLGFFVSSVKGVSYIEFFLPALLCTSSMFVAFFESTYGNFSRLTYQRVYSTMILTPLDPDQIVVGEIFWAASKGFLSAIGVALVAITMGQIQTWMIIPSLFFLFLNSLFFAAFGMLVTSLVKNYDQIIYPTSGLIIPMSLFSGTYFPLDHISPLLSWISYLLPLSHSVTAVRSLLTFQVSYVGLFINALVLIVATAVLIKFAIKRIGARITS